MSEQAENDARIDLAVGLATYIAKHPAPKYSLQWRIAALTGKRFSDPEMEKLVPEVEYWLDLMEWQKKNQNDR